MKSGSRIFVAGQRGLAGSAIVRNLRAAGFENLLLPSHAELDLTDGAAVDEFYRRERPEFVFVAAGRVGGILANSEYPADFIHDNLAIALNSISGAFRHGVTKLVFLSSSCVYPRLAPQPMREEHLLTGPFEPTNEPYAVAKIAGMKLCEAYRRQHGAQFFSILPTNLYGPGDNFDLETSHVLPALIRRFCEARSAGRDRVVVWGSGSPRREFLHADDLADATVFLMLNYEGDGPINVGTGQDVSIRELADCVAREVGFEGSIEFDPAKPDGAPRKLLDVSRLESLGWRSRISLVEGIRATVRWYDSYRIEPAVTAQ